MGKREWKCFLTNRGLKPGVEIRDLSNSENIIIDNQKDGLSYRMSRKQYDKFINTGKTEFLEGQIEEMKDFIWEENKKDECPHIDSVFV